MKTKNAMQLKARINNSAKEAGIPAQAMLQSYLLERLLERLSLSAWRDRVIVKGGVLISSIVGVAARTTVDLDTTVTGVTLTHESAERIFRDVIAVETADDWRFEFDRTEDIRETDDYPGIRVHLTAYYPQMAVPLTVDVTTGDQITPDPIEYEYPLIFDAKTVTLMSYPLETVFAEKLETIISRGVASTRPRDFYDVYMLWKLRGEGCDTRTLGEAFRATCEKRGSATRIASWPAVLDAVEKDELMRSLWSKYVAKNPYAAATSFSACCQVVRDIMESIVRSD